LRAFIRNTSIFKFVKSTTKMPILLLILLIYLFSACENHDYIPPEYFVLNSKVTLGQPVKGFYFEELKIINFPNSSNIIPDFLVLAHTNETGDVLGPMLSHPNIENRFILIKGYDDLTSAKNHFDTLSTISNKQFQPIAMDVKPFEIWEIKDNTGKMGFLLILETRTENINNTPFAEVKFKAKRLN
jgi:hypothetical protein